MDFLKESINKSKIWKYQRDYYLNGKLIYNVKNGLIKWYKIDSEAFVYSEIINDKKNNSVVNFKFIFEGVKYKVYYENGKLFYISSHNNKTRTIIDKKLYELSFNLIKNNFFLMKINIYDMEAPNSVMTIKTKYSL